LINGHCVLNSDLKICYEFGDVKKTCIDLYILSGLDVFVVILWFSMSKKIHICKRSKKEIILCFTYKIHIFVASFFPLCSCGCFLLWFSPYFIYSSNVITILEIFQYKLLKSNMWWPHLLTLLRIICKIKKLSLLLNVCFTHSKPSAFLLPWDYAPTSILSLRELFYKYFLDKLF